MEANEKQKLRHDLLGILHLFKSAHFGLMGADPDRGDADLMFKQAEKRFREVLASLSDKQGGGDGAPVPPS